MASDLAGRPSIADLTGDNHYAQLARKTWLTKITTKVLPETINIDIYQTLEAEGFPYASLLLLEQLQAFERYLWPGFTGDATNQHVILLVLLANVKSREHLPLWTLFEGTPDEFSSFFSRVLHMVVDSSVATSIQTKLLEFIVGAFRSLDAGIVRKECAPLVSIGIWQNLHSEEARERCLSKTAQMQKAWKASGKRFENADAAGQAKLRFERTWLYTLVLQGLDKVYCDTPSADGRLASVLFAERFLELLCDLQSQLPTRRYVDTLLRDLNVLSAVKLSRLYQAEDNTILRGLHHLLEHYTLFPIDNQSGKQLSQQEYEDAHNSRISQLQKAALQLHPEKLKLLVLANLGAISQRVELEGHLKDLSDAELVELCKQLSIRTQYPENSLIVQDRQFVSDVVLSAFELEPFFTSQLQKLTILPTEQSLYASSQLQPDGYDGVRPLALPKLNLQYLTLGDFLWRSYTLYRNEAFYEIRKHLEDTIKRLLPRRDTRNNLTRFDGFSKMAIPITKPAIIDVTPPSVGEGVPAEVKAEIVMDVSRLQPGLRREWEALREGDIVFLLTVQPEDDSKRLTNGHAAAAPEQAGPLKAVRCAEVISVLDEQGRVLRRDQDSQDHVDGFGRPRQRRLLVKLDATAYKEDKARADAGKPDSYDNINLVVRRRARENNFKPVLENIKQLALSDLPLPKWLEEVFLGYGDPSSASYKRMAGRLQSLDYRDTFTNWQHLVESLEGKTLEPDAKHDSSFPPPYVLETVETASDQPVPAKKAGKKRRHDQPDGPDPVPTVPEVIKVSTYQPPNNGPYPTDAPKTNSIRFTTKQIEAIASGTQPGLTLIVGPPGTGKSDTVTQIVSNIYHDFPSERTLLIAHSNQALNQLFQKIAALDIDERHLLRLGHGEEELESRSNFSKTGRVESFLERGLALLADVDRLAASIGAPGAHGASCETAEYFEQVYVRPRWKRFWDSVDAGQAGPDLAKSFPFGAYFLDTPRPLFSPDASGEQVVGIAKGCERHIAKIFAELADIRPFEILRSARDKSNYLLIKEARIVAMTATHAAMRRNEIAALGFRYDNVVMEEAAQVIEMENFIPLTMQKAKMVVSKNGNVKAENPLKRVVLVGDHLQNSPVVQNAAFRSYANLEQSLFLRLMRLGVPHIALDAQGRARPSIAELFKWRYPQLTNLPFTATTSEFQDANAGLRYDYQFIDVPDYKGKGEAEPSPHFLQNLGEAEYAVALYQYMRLLGYPAHKISILTAYAGQRALMRDVLQHRCKGNRLFGMPGWIGTVDKYQGEQNDYVILSLVRTKSPGYLRDLRRLTVALSRARLGLYVLGRIEVFESSLELREAFKLLFDRPSKLSLVTNELYPTARQVEDDVEAVEMAGVEHIGQYVFEMTQAKVKALREEGGQLPPSAQTEGMVGEDDEDDEDEAVPVEEADGMEG